MKAALVALVLAATAGTTSGAHAEARGLIVTCENAISAAHLGPSTSLARARAAQKRCAAAGHMSHLMLTHDGDKALFDAYEAYIDLSDGVGEYVTYDTWPSFHTRTVLGRARGEIARGRREATQALAEL